MAVRSVYDPAPSIHEGRIRIEGDEHRHLAVARIETGESIEIFDGRGIVWTASVETTAKRETVARITSTRTLDRDPVELILALAMIRPAAFELAMEKVVEIGVSRIIPFMAARSNASPADRHERWRRIVVEAAKQSKQYLLPVIDAPAGFERLLSEPAVSKIVFAERGGGPLKSALAGMPALYVIGPEGGWTDPELEAARSAGFHLVSLGAAVLKAETAAIVGAALIRYEFGRQQG